MSYTYYRKEGKDVIIYTMGLIVVVGKMIFLMVPGFGMSLSNLERLAWSHRGSLTHLKYLCTICEPSAILKPHTFSLVNSSEVDKFSIAHSSDFWLHINRFQYPVAFLRKCQRFNITSRDAMPGSLRPAPRSVRSSPTHAESNLDRAQ